MYDKFIVGIDILSISQLPCRQQNPNFSSIDNFDETSSNKAIFNNSDTCKMDAVDWTKIPRKVARMILDCICKVKFFH